MVAALLLGLLSTTPSLAWAAQVSRTITVDCHGRGDVRTVQSAVDSVPDGNRDWIKIHVMAGYAKWWTNKEGPQAEKDPPGTI
jgi:pectinesterase